MRHYFKLPAVVAASFLMLTLAGVAQGQGPAGGPEQRRAAQTRPALTRGQEAPPAAQELVRVKLREGGVFSANFVGADADTFTFKVAGRILEVKRDEVVGISQETELFDRYPDVPFDDEKARLDNLVVRLQEQPSITASIEVYGAVRAAKKRADRIEDYLEDVRRIDDDRFKTSTCVGSKLSVEIWLVPAGVRRKPCSARQSALPPAKKSSRRKGR